VLALDQIINIYIIVHFCQVGSFARQQLPTRLRMGHDRRQRLVAMDEAGRVALWRHTQRFGDLVAGSNQGYGQFEISILPRD
jgi:hypothetical protein